MAQRSTITPTKKQTLVKKFKEGMTAVNKRNLHLREAAAMETGLSTETVNVSQLDHGQFVSVQRCDYSQLFGVECILTMMTLSQGIVYKMAL